MAQVYLFLSSQFVLCSLRETRSIALINMEQATLLRVWNGDTLSEFNSLDGSCLCCLKENGEWQWLYTPHFPSLVDACLWLSWTSPWPHGTPPPPFTRSPEWVLEASKSNSKKDTDVISAASPSLPPSFPHFIFSLVALFEAVPCSVGQTDLEFWQFSYLSL